MCFALWAVFFVLGAWLAYGVLVAVVLWWATGKD